MQVFLKNLKYLIAGIIFGFILMKAEVISWYRIQEMFRLQSFHMFGVIGSAIVTGIISIKVLKLLKCESTERPKDIYRTRRVAQRPHLWWLYLRHRLGADRRLPGATVCASGVRTSARCRSRLSSLLLVPGPMAAFANRLPRFFKGAKSRNKKRVVATHTHA